MIKYFVLLFCLLVIAFSYNAKAQQEVFDDLEVNGKISAISTSSGSHPCPSMTDAQMLAIASPVAGDCVHNSTLDTWLVYDGVESVWEEVGSGGGIASWTTATEYEIGDVVIESNKIYQANADHTSGTFATDIANWTQIANSVSDVTGVLPMANGGTDKNLTPILGGTVYTDAGSMEILAPGTSGQILQTNGAAAPTWVNKSISGKAQGSSSVTVEEVQAPNKLLTQTDTNKHLNETGNKNILENPSFEHATANTGWTLTSGSFVSDNTPIDGAKNAQLTLSSQSLFFSQDSTLYATQFADGVQGLASIRVRTSVTSTPIYVCLRQGGNTGIVNSGCVQVDPNGKWGFYKVPFILGATSNGIAVTSDGVAITGNVEVDDAFVGAQDVKQDMSLIGSWKSWTPTFTGFGTVTNIDMKWRQVGGNIEIRGQFQAGTISSSATYAFTMPNSYSAASSVLTNEPLGPYYFGAVLANSTNYANCANGSDVNFCYQNSASGYNKQTTNTVMPGNGTVFIIGPLTIPVSQLQGATSVYSAQNSDTDWASCGHTPSDFTGFGTVTNIETQCKRQGSDLLVKGKFTSGTGTATEARLALRFNGTALTSANTSKIPSLQLAGDAVLNSQATTYFRSSVLIEPSVAHLTFGTQLSTTNALTKSQGTVFASGNIVSIMARIPISGWDNSNVIIGTFNEVVTTPGVSKPKTCYAAFGTGGSLTSPVACSTGTCTEYFDSCGSFTPPAFSSTGYYTGATFAAGTFANSTALHCSCEAFLATDGVRYECNPGFNTGGQTISASSSGGWTGHLFTSSASGTATNTFVTMKCEGQAP